MIRDCCQVLPGAVMAPGTVAPPGSVWGGAPARLLRRVPESFQEVLVAHTREFFAHFVAKRAAEGEQPQPQQQPAKK
jgi:carbonic anhydrase/acetyltransferase-like protein (isoleucine patch superfamily)